MKRLLNDNAGIINPLRPNDAYIYASLKQLNMLSLVQIMGSSLIATKPLSEQFWKLQKTQKCEKTRKLSQRMYFKERCGGGPKKPQSSWKTVKPFLSTKCKNKNNIFLRENGCLVSDPTVVSDIFNAYFVNIADGKGKDIDGEIPPDYLNDESLIKMISKYDSHPSILAINKANLRDLIAATSLVILLKFDPNHHFSACVTLKFDGWPWKTIGHLFYVASSFVHHYTAISEFKLEL